MANYLSMICRMCLQCNDLVDIFNEGLVKSNFHGKLRKYLAQDIRSEDDMPKYICLNCINRVLDFDSYCVQVAENQLFLRNNFKMHVSVQVQMSNQKADCVNMIDNRLYKVKGGIDLKEQRVEKLTLLKNIENKENSQNIVKIEVEVNNDELNSGEVESLDEGAPDVDLQTQEAKKTFLLKNAENEDCQIEWLEEIEENDHDFAEIETVVTIPIQNVVDNHNSQTKMLVPKMENVNEVTSGNDAIDDHNVDSNSSASKTDTETEVTSQNNVDDDHNTHTNSLVPKTETDFPKTIIKDGRYVIRGKSLMELVSRFYTLKCVLCDKSNLKEKVYPDISRLFSHFKKMHSGAGYVTCCGLKLATPKVLKLHMIRHLQPDAFRCSTCGKKVSTPQRLQDHIRCHLARKPLPNEIRCDECGIKLTSSHILEIHKIKVHAGSSTIESDDVAIEPHKDFPGFPSTIIRNGALVVRGKVLAELLTKFYQFSCDLCEKKEIYPDVPSLFSHFKKAHSIEGYILCCGVPLKTRNSMINHMARHLDPEPFTCPHCGKMTTKPGLLRTHLETHKPSDEKLYYCPKCPKRYSGSGGLEKHLISHIPEEQRRKFICKECGKVCFTLGALQDHIRYTHSDQKLICDQCGKQFKNKYVLAQHGACHNKSKSKSQNQSQSQRKKTRKNYKRNISTTLGLRGPNLPFEKDCTICGETLETKLAMENHMSEKHDTIHKCKLCNYTNKRWELLSRHVASRHIEKKLSCKVCGRNFRYLHLLVDHEQVHTGARRYTCEFCGKKYASASGFCRHRRDMHAVEYEELKRKRREIARNKKLSLQNASTNEF